MKRDRIIQFRGTAHDEERVSELAQKTGLTVSEVLRQLVHSAELQPTSTFRLVANLTNSDASLIFAGPAGIAR